MADSSGLDIKNIGKIIKPAVGDTAELRIRLGSICCRDRKIWTSCQVGSDSVGEQLEQETRTVATIERHPVEIDIHDHTRLESLIFPKATSREGMFWSVHLASRKVHPDGEVSWSHQLTCREYRTATKIQ